MNIRLLLDCGIKHCHFIFLNDTFHQKRIPINITNIVYTSDVYAWHIDEPSYGRFSVADHHIRSSFRIPLMNSKMFRTRLIML